MEIYKILKSGRSSYKRKEENVKRHTLHGFLGRSGSNGLMVQFVHLKNLHWRWAGSFDTRGASLPCPCNHDVHCYCPYKNKFFYFKYNRKTEEHS